MAGRFPGIFGGRVLDGGRGEARAKTAIKTAFSAEIRYGWLPSKVNEGFFGFERSKENTVWFWDSLHQRKRNSIEDLTRGRRLRRRWRWESL